MAEMIKLVKRGALHKKSSKHFVWSFFMLDP